MKVVYLTSVLIGALMLLLQFGIISLNNVREATSTTSAYTVQAESIIADNKREGEVLLDSLKQEYIILAKAVAHYLDKIPSAASDTQELLKLGELLSIDEIHVFNEEGTIIYSTNPEYIGVVTLYSGEQISYFLPMLEDKTLTMCQDITPNTAEGKPMVYAMTWNEAGTQMVQVGIEAENLLEELKAQEIQETVKDFPIDDHMDILVADRNTFKIVGAKKTAYLDKSLAEVTTLKEGQEKGFVYSTRFSESNDLFFCNVGYTEDYCICVFLNHGFFTSRTVESLLIVSLYLLVVFIVIIFVFNRLKHSMAENSRHLQVFQSMSEIYYSLHLVDLKANTAMEYSSRNQVKDAFGEPHSSKADATMIGIMHATMSDAYLQRGLEFTDLTTVAERMRGKKIISMELLGKNVGWIRMSFVTFEEEDGLPTKIIVATQIIDEEKKAAEALYRKSHVDELTGCLNRRAYNTDAEELQKCPGKEFAYVSFDVNGLKTANDDLGHEAGDELLGGAVECMQKVFSDHGKIYRTGGDEFIGLIEADADLMKVLCKEFDKALESWHGKVIKEISVSYGYVLSSEAPGKPMEELASIADKRMYECKAAYYKKKGIDRRRT